MVKESDFQVRKKNVNLFVFLAYLILGVYFINFHFQFYLVPDSVSKFDSWVIFVGGILMIFGAINYFRLRRR